MDQTADELECLYPATLQAAVEQLARRSGEVLVVAGGTSATLAGGGKYRALMDITRMGLDAVALDGGEIDLGCNVRVQQLAASAELAAWCTGVVPEAALSVASRPLRNMITLGGNAVAVFRWSDLPALWLAARARFELLSPRGTRLLEAEDFYREHPRKTLAADELLVRLRLARLDGSWGGAFIKLARTAFDFSIVDVAALVRLEQGRMSEVRIGVAGTSTLPWRAAKAEELLRGNKPREGLLQEAAEREAEGARVMADVRTSKEYRRRMLRVIMARAVQRAVERAGGKVKP